MLIKDWLSGFIVNHQARHPRDDWPSEGSGSPEARILWCQWLEGFIAERVNPAEAEAASREIDGSALDRIEDHLPTLLMAIRRRREEAPARATAIKPDSALTKDDVALMSAAATHEASQLNMWERVARAGELIDEYDALGWSLEWNEKTGRFVEARVEPEAVRVPESLWCRMWAVRAEIYWQLGHPLPGWLPPIEISDLTPKDWRVMVARLAERAEVAR